MRINDLSLKDKLVAITMGVSTGVLVLSALVFSFYQYFFFRQGEVVRLKVLAEAVAVNSEAPLIFSDPHSAEEVLSALAVEESIQHAFVLNKAGDAFASYIAGGNKGPAIVDTDLGDEPVFSRGHLLISVPIRHKDEVIGSIQIKSSLSRMHRSLARYITILAAVLVVAALLALWLINRLQSIVSKPILALTRLTTRLSESKDYSLRAETSSHDEIGTLVEGFNSMIAEIENRDRELQRARDELEDKVHERTKELVKAREVAEEASRMKSQFMANMSHELRTPLNGILGITDLLLDSKASSEQRELLRLIQFSGQLLLEILNDILDFSKVEAGKLELLADDFKLRESLRNIYSLFALQARSKGIELKVDVDEKAPDLLCGDFLRLRQILVNLLGNAIKFTQSGKVILLVKCVSELPDSCEMRFSVLDSGIGVPEDKQRVIFDAFSQADGTMTRKYGGTGLGLTISSQLARMMKGKVWVESPLPAELRVTYDLPDATTAAGSAFHSQVVIEKTKAAQKPAPAQPEPVVAAAPPAAPQEAHNVRVLLVEDNKVNQRVAESILTRSGHKVTIAGNGLEALRVLEEWLNGRAERPFDVILMDLQMPELDGLSATKSIRQKEGVLLRKENMVAGRVPIIALTAHALSEDRFKCQEAGMDDYITKPINRMELLGKINKFCMMDS